jgi:uncharacterized membrane protein YgcG
MKSFCAATLATCALAYPGQFATSGLDITAAEVGGTFDKMNIATYTAPATTAECQITSTVPAAGFVVGTDYTFTLTTDTTGGLGLILFGDAAVLANTQAKEMTVETTWTAAGSAVTIRGLCGAGGSTRIMRLAPALALTVDPASPGSDSGSGSNSGNSSAAGSDSGSGSNSGSSSAAGSDSGSGSSSAAVVAGSFAVALLTMF